MFETSAQGGNNGGWQHYSYDGDGHRVRRNIDGTETWQIYGIGGQLLLEYAANGDPSTPQKEYGYRNGQLLVTAEPSANIHWLVDDQLGTPRMIFDSTGSLAAVSRHDYLPFGEELYAGTNGRTAELGYTSDGVRQRFTGQQRDSETNLDYFTHRYYSNLQGRFTSADVTFADQSEANPQSWNLYTYVGNSPLSFTDPLGLWKEVECTGGGRCFEAEKNDSLSTLAKQYNLNYKDLVKQFGNVGVEVGQTLLVLNPGSIPTSRDGDPVGGGGSELCRSNGDQIRWRMDYDAYLEGLRRGPHADTIILFGPITRLSRLLPAAEVASETKLLGTARMNLLNAAQSAKLRNFIKYLYRENATVGNGSTADAIRYERATGQLLSALGHAQKGEEAISGLNRLLLSGRLNARDAAIAQDMINDLKAALK